MSKARERMVPETVVISFRIVDGVIAEAAEIRGLIFTNGSIVLTGRRHIEDAIARVANAPVGGKETGCPDCQGTGIVYVETGCGGCSGYPGIAHEPTCGTEPCPRGCEVPSAPVGGREELSEEKQ